MKRDSAEPRSSFSHFQYLLKGPGGPGTRSTYGDANGDKEERCVKGWELRRLVPPRDGSDQKPATLQSIRGSVIVFYIVHNYGPIKATIAITYHTNRCSSEHTPSYVHHAHVRL